MSGRIVRVIPRRYYNFSDIATGQGGGVMLAERIDAAEYDKVDVLVRIHALDIGNDVNGQGTGTGKFEVQVYSDGYTCEDPDRMDPPFIAPVGAIVIDAATQVGEFKVAQFTEPLGSKLMVMLSYDQDDVSQRALEGEFSIDLVFKC